MSIKVRDTSHVSDMSWYMFFDNTKISKCYLCLRFLSQYAIITGQFFLRQLAVILPTIL